MLMLVEFSQLFLPLIKTSAQLLSLSLVTVSAKSMLVLRLMKFFAQLLLSLKLMSMTASLLFLTSYPIFSKILFVLKI